MTITDEELLKLTSSLFTEQKGSSDLPPEPLQGNKLQWLQPGYNKLPLHCTATQMRLHFQGSPQAERQSQLPYCGKNPKRKNSRIPEFQDTHSIDSFTYSRSSRYHHISTCLITDNSSQTKKGLTSCKWLLMNFQNEGNNLPGAPWGQLRCHSFLWGTTCASYPPMPKEKLEQTHPKHWPHRTKGLMPQKFDIFPSKMTMWEGKILGVYSPGRTANLQLLTRGFLPV